MTTNAPFKTMVNGYDRYQVDDEIKYLKEELEKLRIANNFQKNEITRLETKLKSCRVEYANLLEDWNVKDKMAQEIARVALIESNSVIQGASNNADRIIKEALSTAKVILTELTYTVKMTKDAKNEMKDKINDILHKIDEFESIQLPSLGWLEKIKIGEDQDV